MTEKQILKEILIKKRKLEEVGFEPTFVLLSKENYDVLNNSFVKIHSNIIKNIIKIYDLHIFIDYYETKDIIGVGI